MRAAALGSLLLLAGCQTIPGDPAAPGGTTPTTSATPTGVGSDAVEFRVVGQAVPTDTPVSGVPGPLPAPPTDAEQARQARQSTDQNVQLQQLAALDCEAPDLLRGASVPDLPLVACAADADEKYILGPAQLTGREIADAVSGVDPPSGGYVVSLTFTSAGTAQWAALTANTVGQRIAFTLDAVVLSAPTVNEAITVGQAVIAGSFTRADAERLADQIMGR